MADIPGTTMPYSDLTQRAFSAIRPLVAAAGGLSLSQLCSITGLEGSTIQNWVKRGWIGRLQGKRYSEAQVARVLLINALRGCLQLESIARLLGYVNGSAMDSSDDIVEEGELFSYLCEAALRARSDVFAAQEIVSEVLSGYEGTADAKLRLQKALSVMVYACLSAELAGNANFLLAELL